MRGVVARLRYAGGVSFKILGHAIRQINRPSHESDLNRRLTVEGPRFGSARLRVLAPCGFMTRDDHE